MQMNDIIGEMQPSDYSSIGNSCCCGCGNLGGLGNGYGWQRRARRRSR